MALYRRYFHFDMKEIPYYSIRRDRAFDMNKPESNHACKLSGAFILKMARIIIFHALAVDNTLFHVSWITFNFHGSHLGMVSIVYC